MGIGGIGIWQLLIILVIVLLLFGTKKLRNLGGDLGGAIRGFKKAVSEEKAAGTEAAADTEEIGKDEQAGEASATVKEAAGESAAADRGDGKSSS